MKYLILLTLLASCSSIPEGKKVMAEQIRADKKILRTRNNKSKETGEIESYLKINIHPQKLKGNLLLKNGVVLVPIYKKKTTWKDVLKRSKNEKD